MDWYFTLKTLHILSAAILFGTGLGIAFFMYAARFAENLHQKYYAARFTVLADFIFTLPAVILQPLTGFLLIIEGGYSFHDTWIIRSSALYLLVGLCWIPVVFIQIRLRNMLRHAIDNDTSLPANYTKLFRIWFLLGWPAFAGVVGIFYLMVAKP
ncbi:MAG: DUF2269 domain-containing protein [Pseudomonadota bacterium]|nr:DUF2269 domain-containing protein [Pseudomonadota bacterium]QKK06313.1 MAG: DUF2269 domain-containing protein [Pseudomonadota bacterium]